MLARTILLFLIISSSQAIKAEPRPIVLDRPLKGELFGHFMSYVEDPTSTMSIDDVRALPQERFSSINIDSPKFGFSHSSYWLRFVIENPKSGAQNLLIESRYSLIDRFDLFQYGGDELLSLQRLGDRRPFKNRLVDHRHAIFQLEVPPGLSEYYLKVKTEGSVNIALEFWSPEAFHSHSQSEYLFVGFVFGCLLVMALYNLFLAISFRSKSYLCYVAYILCFVTYLLGSTGLGMQILPWQSESNLIQNTGLLLSIQGSNFFAILFSSYFFDLRRRMPRIGTLFIVLMGLNALLLVSILFLAYNPMAKAVNGVSAITALALIANGIYNIRKGYRPALYYTIAWVGILAGNLAFALSVSGAVEVSFVTTWGQAMGGASEVVLLSLALGSRVNYIRAKQDQEIRNLNQELKHHIENIEDIVRQKTRDIKSIMANIKQGIFTLNYDPDAEQGAVLGPDYSNHLRDFVDIDSRLDLPVLEAIFADALLSSDQKNQIAETLMASLGEDELNFEANQSLLPHEFELKANDGSIKQIEIDWSPVVNEQSGLIEKVLVSMRDVSSIRALQRQAEQQREEMDYIAEILNVDVVKFNKLMETAYRYLDENLILLERNPEKSKDVLRILYINIHTLKGIARSYRLLKITDKLHEIEKNYARLQQNSDAAWERDLLVADLQSARALFDRYNQINIEKLNRGNMRNRIMLEKSFLDQKISHLRSIERLALSEQDQTILKETSEALERLYLHSSDRIFEDFETVIGTLARDLGKETPELEIINPGFYLTDEGADLLHNVFTHVIRNTMDHGLEHGDERIKKGKLPTGRIRVEMRAKDRFLEILYEDDGRGLNLAKLYAIGQRKSLLSDDHRSDVYGIANLIFYDGLSTAERVSDISGRGVGMGAIKRFVEQIGGQFELILKEEATVTDEAVAFAIVMTLPDKLWRFYSLAAA